MRKVLALLALATAAAACKRASLRYSTDVIATINGKSVTLPALRRYFQMNAGRPINESSPRVVSALFDQFLREEILRQAAGLGHSDEMIGLREAPALLLGRAGPAAVPTEARIRQEYDQNRERYRRPEEAQVARIFTRKPQEAGKARQRVEDGEEFGAVARQVSGAPDAARGGEMGWVARGDLPSAFEQAIFALKPGQTTPVLEAEDGFVFFKLERVDPPRTLTFEEAEPEIRDTLARQMAAAYLETIVAKVKEAGEVRIFSRRLPFVYSGTFSVEGE